jgi:hypothetical protein
MTTARNFCKFALEPTLLIGALALCVPLSAQAAETTKFTGRILGMVKAPGGVAQMGATVQLLNRFDKPISRALTDEKGLFAFDSLGPETYSIRVSVASFVPAIRTGIQVLPGAERYLAIQLAALFSSVELFYSPPPGTFLMTEEWRAALRSSLATRPALRMLPTISKSQPLRVFTDTRALVRLSSGDTETSNSWGSQLDLGTAFAVGTSIHGRSQVQFAGNLGYGMANGIPAAGFRTTYRRIVDSPIVGFDAPSPQVSVTMRQLFLPLRAGLAASGNSVAGANSGVPMLRTLSATFVDRFALGDRALVEYGSSMDSVQFYERLNCISPFARLTVEAGRYGTIKAAFSSGFPPVDLLIRGEGEHTEMQRHLSTLALFPRITRRAGTTRAQRVENFELGYTKKIGSGEVFAAAYREGISNAGIALLGAGTETLGEELVPDLSTNASIFNIGGFYRNGFLAGWTQSLPGDWKLATGYGMGAVLRTDQRTSDVADSAATHADNIRSSIYQKRRNFLSMRLNGTLPQVGTKLYSSYLWTDYRALTPFHTSLTTPGLSEAGLNVGLRQPIPGFLGLPGRLEIHAEMRNMLAQGYVPITTAGGRTVWLIPTPKQVRGGLSFIF